MFIFYYTRHNLTAGFETRDRTCSARLCRGLTSKMDSGGRRPKKQGFSEL
jgi:hypothetical protein